MLEILPEVRIRRTIQILALITRVITSRAGDQPSLATPRSQTSLVNSAGMHYTPPVPQWLIPSGRIFYAIGLIGIGIQHFIFSDFIPVIIPFSSSSIPSHQFLAYAIGAALIAAGLAMLFNVKARAVATISGAVFLFLALLAHLPAQLFANPMHLAVWTNAFKALTLCGGAWIVAGSLDGQRPFFRSPLERFMRLGRFFLPITVIAFGIDHFLYPDFVASLVPRWIPGPAFWTYFAAIALIAAGIAMIVKVFARWASLLLGMMIFLWFLFLHIPRAIADPHSHKGNEWTSVFEALAFSGIAFILAALPSSNPFSFSWSE
jgi:uncharacterized membrane protein YphA (DoxX/SURF4 family)